MCWLLHSKLPGAAGPECDTGNRTLVQIHYESSVGIVTSLLWLKYCMTRDIVSIVTIVSNTSCCFQFQIKVDFCRQFGDTVLSFSISNGSGLPGFSSHWNWNRDPCPGEELPREMNQVTCARWLPRPDIIPQFFGLVGNGLQFHFDVCKIFAPIKFSSSYHNTTWSICKTSSVRSSFTP